MLYSCFRAYTVMAVGHGFFVVGHLIDFIFRQLMLKNHKSKNN